MLAWTAHQHQYTQDPTIRFALSASELSCKGLLEICGERDRQLQTLT